MKICVSFKNSHYPIEIDHQNVSDSSMDEWQVTIIESEFTTATIYHKTKPTYKHIAIYCLMNFGQYTDAKFDKLVNNEN